jgi:hypothetical protein
MAALLIFREHFVWIVPRSVWNEGGPLIRPRLAWRRTSFVPFLCFNEVRMLFLLIKGFRSIGSDIGPEYLDEGGKHGRDQ